jgi:hypothetical protein
MSRSGYIDDIDDQWSHIRWRGAVASAMRGKRGQAFLREMLAAMDAMPEKKLIANDLETADGAVCAIGSVGKARGVDMREIDPENYSLVAGVFGIAEPMAQEIVFMNDEAFIFETDAKGFIKKDENGKDIRLTPEGRFQKMRAWIASQIREVQP